MSSSEFNEEFIISFLSQPIPKFNSIQKELFNNEKQLVMKTHLAFHSICNEIIIELIQNELENFIEKEDDIKSLDSISQISKSNSSIHSLKNPKNLSYKLLTIGLRFNNLTDSND